MPNTETMDERLAAAAAEAMMREAEKAAALGLRAALRDGTWDRAMVQGTLIVTTIHEPEI